MLLVLHLTPMLLWISLQSSCRAFTTTDAAIPPLVLLKVLMEVPLKWWRNFQWKFNRRSDNDNNSEYVPNQVSKTCYICNLFDCIKWWFNYTLMFIFSQSWIVNYQQFTIKYLTKVSLVLHNRCSSFFLVLFLCCVGSISIPLLIRHYNNNRDKIE